MERQPHINLHSHPLEMHEQAALLGAVGIESIRGWPSRGKQFRGYGRVQFEEASRKPGSAGLDEASSASGRLRLIGGSDQVVTGVTAVTGSDDTAAIFEQSLGGLLVDF